MTTQYNINTELSVLTRVPSKVFAALSNKISLCIGNAINDARLKQEPYVQVNIGIGVLSISMTDMQCKFLPSKELKSTIKKCIVDGVNPLELQLEQALSEKLIDICDEEL